MGQWLQEWAQVLSAFATSLMMLAWVFYAQFAIFTYLSQRKARVVIDQTEDRSLDTKFVVVNLSELPVYISCVTIAVRRNGEERLKRVSTYSHFMSSDDVTDPHHLEAELRHGTLDPAGLLMLGGSDRILSWLLDDDNDEDSDAPRQDRLRRALSKIDHFDIRIIAMAGNEDKPIASRRRFLVEEAEEKDEITIYPEFSQTQHFNSWRDRKTVHEWSEHCLRS